MKPIKINRNRIQFQLISKTNINEEFISVYMVKFIDRRMRSGGHLFVLRSNTNGFDLTAFSLFSSATLCDHGVILDWDTNVTITSLFRSQARA